MAAIDQSCHTNTRTNLSEVKSVNSSLVSSSGHHHSTHPEELQPLIEKITRNSEQGNPDNVLKTLHETALKGEGLSNESSNAVALNRETFPSKTVHYCANGKYNPLVKSHGPEKCWQLHPELRTEQKTKESRPNFTLA
ncbi:hypothetical protein O181_008155 [Austropuccinia psidii MF-1]|uniref:Uncharacterized protein n=1 Tax=Austropuccinia psidii MF-1 TaxID=1389203 RepID=A0A9Q3BNS8_9BASI|nr:hypothetical protein [Austropuccinia psidii MF-1]